MDYFRWGNTYIEDLNGLEQKKYIQVLKIIKYLYVHGPNTNANICKHLNISAPKSFSLLNELIDNNVIEKKGRGESIGGRKPDLYRIKDQSLYVLSIDMGLYKTRISIFDSNNKDITGVNTFNLELNSDEKILDRLVEYANKLISDSGIDPQKLLAIGISIPGLVDSENGINHTYLNLGETPVTKYLEESFGRPVFIENDAKALALAEYRFGKAKGKKNVLVLYLDWGIGLGLILDGKLYRGSSGFAGEFSHIPIQEDGYFCRCGKHGCLETIASGTYLVNQVKDGLKAGKKSTISLQIDGDLNKIDVKMVIDAACNGDQYAISMLSEVGFNLGKGLAILIQLLNPELLILGGKIAAAGQYIITPIQQSLNTYTLQKIRDLADIQVSDMSNNAGNMGAVAVVMEHIFEEQFKLVGV